MSLSKANISGLTSPQQRSEMKSILAGTWPALKPLPVFKYETHEYRATIDFDKLRGEWVCRKTSFPSNKVQELRGELREITLALPHGETPVLMEGTEEQGQELEKDANRRLQAIRDWRENYENGARYFEIRNYLSENQRNETDDSLRLSLTARQLQFNPKNIAYVFDALLTAGGRFAALMEFAKRNKARQETAAQAQGEGEGAVPEAECAIDRDKQSLGISSQESGPVLNDLDSIIRGREIVEGSTDADELPAVSIKNVFPEQYQAPLAEPMTDTEGEPSEMETSEIVGECCSSLAERSHQERPYSPASADFTEQVPPSQSSEDRSGYSSSRLPVLEISAFHLALFASLFLFAVMAFAVGLTVGRGPLGSRLRELPSFIPTFGAKSPALPEQADQEPSRISSRPVASSNKPANTNRLSEPAPSPEELKENTAGAGHLGEARSQNVTAESKPSAKPIDSPKVTGTISGAPRNPAPSQPSSTIVAAPHLPRPSTILVNVPGRGSQPFRVSFPEKPIAASPSLAMSSQLSVLVSPEHGRAVAHRPARLEAGELVSFVWPRYPKLGDRYRVAQVIRVRVTIGPLGEVREVKSLSGSSSLLPATIGAVRQWRYMPTLLDKRPVEVQQDLTIELRAPQNSSRPSTRHLTQKLVAVD